MAVSTTDPADLGVGEAVSALAEGELSSLELVEACLRRIEERDGTHSHDGDPASINAWVRVYAEDAIEAARRADRVPADERHPLHGVPVGLKDVYAVAGKPLTASSRAFEDVPDRDSDVWASLKAAGMVLLGHLGGSRTILVRSGMSGSLDLNGVPESKRPDAVINGVEEMLPWL